VSAARARRDSARAAVIRLEAEASKYRILAPIDGVVIARRADPGETVAAATPLLTIADLSRLRVEAEIDEFDIPRLVPGTRVTITAEGYGAQHWEGEVEEIADIVIGRQTRPEDPSRPTDTRILPIKVKLSEPTPLKLGQRVDVQVFVPGQDR
jgi:multidrug resistance efflux pump